MTYSTWKRIFVKIDMDLKNHIRLDANTEINLRRDTDNFDKKYTNPINGIVVQSDKMPIGAEILLHHNACHDTYRIFDFKEINGEYTTDRYFSIPESECYTWRIGNGEWQPCEGFELGLRVFKPYSGVLPSILPTQIKNKLYITTGELKDKVVMTKGASDYEMIFQDKNGRESRLIRIRHFNEPNNLREEIVAICHGTTEQVKDGRLLIGLSPTNLKMFHVEDYINQ